MATFDEVIQEIEGMKRKGERIKQKGQQAEGQKRALFGEVEHIFQELQTEIGIELSLPDSEDKDYQKKLAENIQKVAEFQKGSARKITEQKNQMAEILRELGEEV